MRSLLINPPVLAVDPYQVYAYADVTPYGLFQIATWLAERGQQVAVLDMMGYLEGDYDRVLSPQRLFAEKACGDAHSPPTPCPVYLYGRDFDWLAERLAAEPEPDEIWVTCCLAFNFEPAHRVIAQCRQAFPQSRIRFGGFYPTAFADHAARAGADEVFCGRLAEADRVFPRLELCERIPRNWLFSLVSGCRYRCSFCINSASQPELACDPRQAADEIARLRLEYGIEEFSNWDPNVLQIPDALSDFLDELARCRVDVALRFDMGITPHRLTPELAAGMLRAGTVAMTIPFESVDPAMLRRFGKPYRVDDSLRALETCRRVGFDISRFHCTFLLGVRDESLASLFRTHLTILSAGGKPTPFPLTPTPGTREYAAHRRQLEGKDLDLLNGHLWPTQPAPEGVELYRRLLDVVSCLDVDSARSQAARLPQRVGEIFERELAAHQARQHAPGARSATPDGDLPRPRLKLPAWLHAMCTGCVDLGQCADRQSRREPDPERCFRARRGIDLNCAADLFADLRRRTGFEDAALADRLATHEQHMWRHLEELQTRCASTFEPSLSWDGRRWSWYRYTYSFSDGEPERWPADVQTLLSWMALLDTRLVPHAGKLLELARPPLARGLLFGMDAQPRGNPRTKIYFRLEAGLAKAKARLLRALVGPGWTAGGSCQAADLFILGFDLGPGGVKSIKYYFLRERLDNTAFEQEFALDALLPRVGRFRALAEWREVIHVTRQRGPQPAAALEPVEANVHCLRNDLRLDDLQRAWTGCAAEPDLQPVGQLFAQHPLLLSSLTTPLAAGDKVNLYYRLAPTGVLDALEGGPR